MSGIEQAARAAGATVLGEDGTTQHYLMTAEQLARMVALLQSLPPPLPQVLSAPAPPPPPY